MYTNILRTNIAGPTLSLLTVSIISICMGVNANAITPEQYQEQRSEALKQQQLVKPNVSINTDTYQQTPSTSIVPTSSQNADAASIPCFDIDHIYLTGELSEKFTFALIPDTKGKSSLLGSCLSIKPQYQPHNLSKVPN